MCAEGCPLCMHLHSQQLLCHIFSPSTESVPKANTVKYSNSSFHRTATLWNSRPISCFSPSYNLCRFKRNENKYLFCPKFVLIFIVKGHLALCWAIFINKKKVGFEFCELWVYDNCQSCKFHAPTLR